MRVNVLLLLALMGVPLAACGDEEDPGNTVSVGDGTGGRRDGGPGGGAGGVLGGSGTGARGGSGGRGGGDDAGLDASDDAGLDGSVMGSVWCADVEPAPLDVGEPDPDAEIGNGVSAPVDLVITRAETLWEVGCAVPTLKVTLSDGGCPVGEGHELTFFIPARGTSNSLVIGQNVIREELEPGHIRARYTRPSRFSDDGVWGTCEGAAGTLDVIGEIDLDEGSILQASFMLELTRCDGESPDTIQIVNGTFSIEIPESLDEVCPM